MRATILVLAYFTRAKEALDRMLRIERKIYYDYMQK